MTWPRDYSGTSIPKLRTTAGPESSSNARDPYLDGWPLSRAFARALTSERGNYFWDLAVCCYVYFGAYTEDLAKYIGLLVPDTDFQQFCRDLTNPVQCRVSWLRTPEFSGLAKGMSQVRKDLSNLACILEEKLSTTLRC